MTHVPHIGDAVSRACLALLALLAAGLLAGCGGRVMKIPDLPPVGEVPPLARSPDNATFALSRVVVTIKRGTVTARYPLGLPRTGGRSVACNTRDIDNWVEVWASGRTNIGDWRYPLGEVFYEMLTDKGFSVAGDPNDLFKRGDAVASAEYLIGARVFEMRSNYCEHDTFKTYDFGYFGETYVEVEWTVFSSLSQQAVFVQETAGYHRTDKPRTYGKSDLFHEAFADALRRFAKHPEFRRIATREFRPREASEGGRGTIFLPAGKIKDRDIGGDLGAVRASIAAIRAGRARGSGFIVGTGGYLLTSADLVGATASVRVTLSNGVEVDGRVLRASPAQDVALVKIPVRSPASLPIRLKRTRPAEPVHAIGGPSGDGLGVAVATGVVSGHRIEPMTGSSLIRSDAAVPPGGLLLDRFGNVVGISVSRPAGLFLPIADALAAVDVKLKLD